MAAAASSPAYRPGQVADLVGVSVDTVRRWADAGLLKTRRTSGGQRLVDGADLARFLATQGDAAEPGVVVAQSARNRFTGIVTKVVKDKVAATVELRVG